MLGYTGEYEGKPVSVQATGMGCPSAAIVMEELVAARREALPARRHLRRPAAGPRARRPDRRAVGGPGRRRRRSATPGGEPHVPDRRLGARARRRPRREGARRADRVGADRVDATSSTTRTRAATSAGRTRGVLAVEMEAADALHDRRAARRAGRLPADGERHRRRRSVHAGSPTRTSQAAVDRMTRVALATVTSDAHERDRLPRQPRVATTARPGGAGRSSRGAPPSSACAATRSSPSGPGS